MGDDVFHVHAEFVQHDIAGGGEAVGIDADVFMNEGLQPRNGVVRIRPGESKAAVACFPLVF